jgi:hypothetical protein
MSRRISFDIRSPFQESGGTRAVVRDKRLSEDISSPLVGEMILKLSR